MTLLRINVRETLWDLKEYCIQKRIDEFPAIQRYMRKVDETLEKLELENI